MWQVTGDRWHVTHDTWHMTHSVGWTFSQNFSSLALPVLDWQCFEYISTNHEWVSQSFNHKGICKTAPATRDLLNNRLVQFLQESWVGGERRRAWWRGWLAIGTGRSLQTGGNTLRWLKWQWKWNILHSVGWTFSQNCSVLALPVCDWQCFEYISTNHESLTLINQLIN